MELLECLSSIGMEKYNDIIDEDVDGEIVNGWKIDDFEVSDVFDRLKLYLFFTQLKPDCKTYSTLQVVHFLESQPDLKQYMDMFNKYRINGDVLLQSTTSLLKEIGVKTHLEASRIIVLFRKWAKDSDYDHEKSKEKLKSAINQSNIKDKDVYFNLVKSHDISFHILQEGGIELLVELVGISSKRAQLVVTKLKCK